MYSSGTGLVQVEPVMNDCCLPRRESSVDGQRLSVIEKVRNLVGNGDASHASISQAAGSCPSTSSLLPGIAQGLT